MKKGVLIVLLFVMFLQFANSDIFSSNSGGDGGLIINPDTYLEGFFFQGYGAPTMSNVVLSSVPLGTNTTHENLTVTYSSSGNGATILTNISDWRLNGVSIAVLNMPFDRMSNSITTGSVDDYSIFQNNGTLGGGDLLQMPAWNYSGKVGGCYSFDGVDNYILVPDDDSLDGFSSMSVFFWAEPIESSISEMIIKHLSTQSNVNWEVFQSSLNIAGRIVGTTVTCTTTGNLFTVDNWHYVGMTWNGTQIKMYIDGDEITSCDRSASMTNSAGNLSIGRYQSSSSNYPFNGSIDEIKVYSIALTPEQVQADYQAGLAGHSAETIVSQETDIGQTWGVAMTSNNVWFNSVTVLSNNLTIENSAPNDPNPVLVSVNGRNESDADLNCSFDVVDVDSSSIDVTVNWMKDGESQINLSYNNIANGTPYYSILNSSNLTLGDIWKCSVRYYDGYLYSNWVDSNELEIIDITPPNITIISPNSSVNYTDLNVTFNVSLSENGSVCYYDLDSQGNLSMIKLNNTYFWILDDTFTSGGHNVTFWCNDTSDNWGTNFTNFTIEDEAAISILLSPKLSWSVLWNVTSVPVDDLDAEGNNLTNATDYYINVSATNTLVDIYVKADGDLHTNGLEVLGLENENYTVSLVDPNVTGASKATMTTDYVIIADGVADGAVVYMKFYLDVPAGQGAGLYYNNLNFKAVRNGESP